MRRLANCLRRTHSDTDSDSPLPVASSTSTATVAAAGRSAATTAETLSPAQRLSTLSLTQKCSQQAVGHSLATTEIPSGSKSSRSAKTKEQPGSHQPSQSQKAKSDGPGSQKDLQSLPNRGILKGQSLTDYDAFLAGSFQGIRSKPYRGSDISANQVALRTHESDSRVKTHREHLARLGQPDVWGCFAIEVRIGPKRDEDAKESLSAFVHAMAVKHNRTLPVPIPRIKTELKTPDSFTKPVSTWVFQYVGSIRLDARAPTRGLPTPLLLSSPTLTEGYSLEAWERDIQATWQFLTENYEVVRKADWGTGVTIMPAAGFHFNEIKLLAQAFIHFRPPLDLYLHDTITRRPGAYGPREIRISNAGGRSVSGVSGCRNFLSTDWSQFSLLKDKTPSQAIAAVEAATEWDDISRIFVLAAWLINYEGNETASELYIANLASVVRPEHGLSWVDFFICFSRGVMARQTLKRLLKIPSTPQGLQFLLTGRHIPEGASQLPSTMRWGKVRGGGPRQHSQSNDAASSGQR